MLLSLVSFPSCGVLPACTSFHSRRAPQLNEEKKQKTHNLVQGFIDIRMVSCYCMAICMYVVALVNRISFDKRGEEMNKVIDAINQTCRPSLFSAAHIFSSDGESPAVCNFHSLTRNRGLFLWNMKYRGNIMTHSYKCSRRTVLSIHLQARGLSFVTRDQINKPWPQKNELLCPACKLHNWLLLWFWWKLKQGIWNQSQAFR